MTSVMKSPNMMSTTGRIPVIAAPSPRPAIPASEIGESTTRSGPNSSTRPDSTLNGVPASATSSPMMNTVGSRRSSSASASFTAWAKVSSGKDVLRHLCRIGEGSVEREAEADLDLGARLVLEPFQVVGRGELPLLEPGAEDRQRVALAPPEVLLLLRAVVRAVDVADVVAVVAIRVREQERGPAPGACARDELDSLRVHGAHVLPVDLARLDSERSRPREDVAGRRLEVMGVLVVLVVLADVDDRELPERRHVHDLVDEALPECALAEEPARDLVRAEPVRRERRPRRDPGRAADDGVRAEVSVLVVGDVHRTALAAAVAGFPSEQLREHAADVGALREAVAVTAVRRRDPVVAAQCAADADGDGLLADVEVRQARHLRAAVELVGVLLEQPDQRHPAVHVERQLRVDLDASRRRAHARSRRRPSRRVRSLVSSVEPTLMSAPGAGASALRSAPSSQRS